MANPLKRWTEEDLAIAKRFGATMLLGMHLLDERDETAMNELVRTSPGCPMCNARRGFGHNKTRSNP